MELQFIRHVINEIFYHRADVGRLAGHDVQGRVNVMAVGVYLGAIGRCEAAYFDQLADAAAPLGVSLYDLYSSRLEKLEDFPTAVEMLARRE